MIYHASNTGEEEGSQQRNPRLPLLAQSGFPEPLASYIGLLLLLLLLLFDCGHPRQKSLETSDLLLQPATICCSSSLVSSLPSSSGVSIDEAVIEAAASFHPLCLLLAVSCSYTMYITSLAFMLHIFSFHLFSLTMTYNVSYHFHTFSSILSH